MQHLILLSLCNFLNLSYFYQEKCFKIRDREIKKGGGTMYFQIAVNSYIFMPFIFVYDPISVSLWTCFKDSKDSKPASKIPKILHWGLPIFINETLNEENDVVSLIFSYSLFQSFMTFGKNNSWINQFCSNWMKY